jgi:hypothetical protein
MPLPAAAKTTFGTTGPANEMVPQASGDLWADCGQGKTNSLDAQNALHRAGSSVSCLQWQEPRERSNHSPSSFTEFSIHNCASFTGKYFINRPEFLFSAVDEL